MSNRFTEKAESALNRSLRLAEELGHTYIGSEHILVSLCEDERSCSAVLLLRAGINKAALTSAIKDYYGLGERTHLSSRSLTPRARTILEGAYDNAAKYSDGIIGTEHILLSVTEVKDAVAIKLLKSLRVDISALKDSTLALIREKRQASNKTDISIPYLKQYGKNFCEEAKRGCFDPCIGRDKETSNLIRILCRKNKNNPCLIGEAGVGKTAIVEGLAQRIVSGNVPDILRSKMIISVDLTSMVAGAKYRGDFEERIKNIVAEASKYKEIILFIDEIHTIVGAGAAEGAIDASNILKPQLARGEIQLIGATTYKEYRKYIEKDSALERRFRPVEVNEPSHDGCIDMLLGLKERYERHHGVTIEDAAIEECVLLSEKYIADRFLPDKAVDLLDEACVFASANVANSANTVEINEQNYDHRGVCNNFPELLFDLSDLPAGNIHRDACPVVTQDSVRSVVSEMCDIPLSSVKHKTDYAAISDNLKSRIFGQNRCIEIAVSTVKRRDLGFALSERPRASLLFVGDSGVGKLKLANELAKELAPAENEILRFDMSEYTDKQSVSKLLGSPAGYVGYDEGGLLTESVRKKPHSVIVFDGIERADKDIANLISEIIKNGSIRDAAGRSASFKNNIVIATLTKGINSRGSLGFVENDANGSVKALEADIKKRLGEELFDAFDEVIYFDALSKDTLKSILLARLEAFVGFIKKKGIGLDIDEGCIDLILSSSPQPELDIKGVIRSYERELEDAVSDHISELDDFCGCIIKVSPKDGGIAISSKSSLTI